MLDLVAKELFLTRGIGVHEDKLQALNLHYVMQVYLELTLF